MKVANVISPQPRNSSRIAVGGMKLVHPWSKLENEMSVSNLRNSATNFLILILKDHDDLGMLAKGVYLNEICEVVDRLSRFRNLQPRVWRVKVHEMS